ncbi:MAG TPA: CvpA family protein [Gammaproteobacteria bacterium]|jgi:hypothetical protein|nr:CvpA family protein [Gammaproteobacteria bacterium]
MGNFFDNLWNAISALAWSDWFTLIILISFIVRGFIQGLAKEIISLFFVILAIILAWLYYESFANAFFESWLSSDAGSAFASAFGIIFVGTWFTKKGLYRLMAISSEVKNPCDLNYYFAVAVLVALVAFLSYQYLESLAQLQTMQAIVNNDSLRNFLSFAVVFTTMFVFSLALAKILNITIDNKKPCFLAPIFEKILKGLNVLDSFFNARNVGGLKNQFFGSIVGLFKGGIFVLIIVLVLQNLNWATQNHAWVETTGTLRIFQDWGVDIKPFLSKHLLFIDLEPGDVLILESDIKIEG